MEENAVFFNNNGGRLDLIRDMLVGMMVGSSGSVPKGFKGTVKEVFPAVDILPVGFIASCSVGDTMFISVVYQRNESGIDETSYSVLY